MSKAKLRKIRQEVKEKELAKIRWQWFREYKKCRDVSKVCRKYGISRSVFYYWKPRIDLKSSGNGQGYSKQKRLLAYSRKPKTNPKAYPEHIVKLITKIRKRTKRGAEYIWFMLKDKYATHLSVTGIYKTLKREGLIQESRDTQASIDFLSKVRLFYPFPIKVIQTDNGFEFTWRLHPEITKIHPFTLQCQLYGYEHKLIPPAYPRANSHVERTHRTDEEYVYRGRTFTSLAQLHKINLRTLKEFNEKHPQKTKHFMPPLQFGILKYRLQKQKLNYTVLNV